MIFFFKQKTAYEMRISDWSSDVCSSDLPSPESLLKLPYPEVTLGAGKVYLAAPFFDLAQRWLVEEARSNLLDMGAQVFSPVHEVGPGPASIVAHEDIAGLEAADVVFSVLNGVDPGTILDVGYAVKRGIPVLETGRTSCMEKMWHY